jgi:hypothetical protein
MVLLQERRAAAGAAYTIDYPRTPELLDRLYEIDCEAYGSHAVDRSILERWVAQCPQTITLLMIDGEIIGAFGLLAVSEEQIRLFIAGKLEEKDFISLPEDVEGHRFWYWSGVVVVPEYRRSQMSPLRPLLARGIDAWLSSGRASEDAYVFACGCTKEGTGLLGRFRFEQIKSASEMADDAALYSRRISASLETNRAEIRELLGARS